METLVLTPQLSFEGARRDEAPPTLLQQQQPILGPSLQMPPPMPLSLKRQTTADRAAACDGIWNSYIEAIEGIEEPDGAFGGMENITQDHHDRHLLNDEFQATSLKAIVKEVRVCFGVDLDVRRFVLTFTMKLAKQIRNVLPKQIEISSRASMFVRYDEEHPQFMRACLTGVEGSPYSNGVFVFDVYCPPDYPNTNCLCTHVTAGAQCVMANNGPGGFSPNLHNDSGKVCLSLLGTWDGPGWESGKSNVYQVLSSIMWMILGAEHPYHMEPGFGGWEGTVDPNMDVDEVLWYDEEVKWGTAQIAILDQLRNPPRGFEKVVRKHLLLKRKIIMATLKAWHDKGTDRLKERLAPVMLALEEEYKRHLDVDAARGDVREREQEVEFIRNKMDFLEKKLKACAGDPQVVMPKAYQRFQIGPALLQQALTKLQAAQQTLADAEVRDLQERTEQCA